MVNRAGFRVEGLSQVVRDLQAVGAEVEDLKGAFGEIADTGAQIAKRYTPSRSGKLRGATRGNRAKNKAVITQGRATVPYAGPINYGWPRRNIEPALQLQRTDRDMEPRALQLLEDQINEAIERRGLG
jgi:hypothetical protein